MNRVERDEHKKPGEIRAGFSSQDEQAGVDLGRYGQQGRREMKAKDERKESEGWIAIVIPSVVFV